MTCVINLKPGRLDVTATVAVTCVINLKPGRLDVTATVAVTCVINLKPGRLDVTATVAVTCVINLKPGRLDVTATGPMAARINWSYRASSWVTYGTLNITMTHTRHRFQRPHATKRLEKRSTNKELKPSTGPTKITGGISRDVKHHCTYIHTYIHTYMTGPVSPRQHNRLQQRSTNKELKKKTKE